MEYSTDVTKYLVKAALRDLVTVVLDCKYHPRSNNGKMRHRTRTKKKGVDTGRWELIHEGKDIRRSPESLSCVGLEVKGAAIDAYNPKPKTVKLKNLRLPMKSPTKKPRK